MTSHYFNKTRFILYDILKIKLLCTVEINVCIQNILKYCIQSHYFKMNIVQALLQIKEINELLIM